MKKILVIVMICSLIAIVYCGCSETHETTNPAATSEIVDPTIVALSYYIEYLEACQIDARDAIEKYRHFENEETRQLCLDNATLHLDYEIIRIEKLSDGLWAVELFLQSELIKEGYYLVQYVGVIKGEMKVMGSDKEIPTGLKEGVEIEEYKPHGPGIVGTEDVLGAP